MRRHPLAPAHVVRISVATSRTDFTARDADFAALIRTADGKSLKSWIVPIPDTTKLHRLGENVAAAAVELPDSAERRRCVSLLPRNGHRGDLSRCPRCERTHRR